MTVNLKFWFGLRLDEVQNDTCIYCDLFNKLAEGPKTIQIVIFVTKSTEFFDFSNFFFSIFRNFLSQKLTKIEKMCNFCDSESIYYDI